jgi:hypothetical protein
MGRMKFNETWWNRGHEMFVAHEEGGLIGAHAPPIKNLLIAIGQS